MWRALLVALAAMVLAAPPAARAQGAPAVAAAAAVLMDARTGQILYALNAHARRPPASTTKILAALVALQRLPSDAPIRITKRAELARQGSAIGLTEGETYRFRDLLHALLMQSANDAAVAIAETAAGSVEAFAALMNREARRLGARDTHFVNPHGLYRPDHRTSAYDLALFARAAIAYPAFNDAVRTLHYTFEGPAGPREVWGRNKLLWKYPEADGIKTGWVAQSGPCLVGSATRNGRRLIAVVLHSGDMYGDAMRLLSYGFARFPLRIAVPARQVVARFPVGNGERPVAAAVERDVALAVPAGHEPVVVTRPAPALSAPVERGDTVGTVTVMLDGRPAASARLVAAFDVPARSWWARVWAWMRAGGQPRATAGP